MPSTHLIMASPRKDNNNPEKQPAVFRELLKAAVKELREDENSRQQCLQHLREWIQKNEDIENCLTDDRFLLRFLRVKKFSIPMAEQTLLKYLNFRNRFRDFMFGLDYLESDLINKGYIFASPFRDANGRKVIIYDLKKINPHEVTGRDICLAHIITYETLLTQEDNQILGFNHVADVDGLSAAFLTLWSIGEFATIIRWGEQSIPMRHKEVNILNFPSALKYVYDFIRSNIKSQKLRDRIVMYDSLSEMHSKVNKSCLPSELGGVMPMQEMRDLWKKELADKRDLLLSYDSMKLLSDKGIICKRNAPTHDDTGIGSLPGSFRKLEVD